MSFIEPVILKGERVTLEPLGIAHLDGLTDAVKDGALWKLWYTTVPKPETMRHEIERRLDLQSKGSMLPFAVRSADDGTLRGMTT